jgi:hypothetical protein
MGDLLGYRQQGLLASEDVGYIKTLVHSEVTRVVRVARVGLRLSLEGCSWTDRGR